MKFQLRRGKLSYISFILINIVSLIISNIIAGLIYLVIGKTSYSFAGYSPIILLMMVIELFVIIFFNTLNQVLRRNGKAEAIECLKHVFISLLLLTLALFSMKRGAAYSRVTVYLAYGIYFVLLMLTHTVWKRILENRSKDERANNVLLVTGTGYAEEGIKAVNNTGMSLKGIFMTDQTGDSVIEGIPTLTNLKDAQAFLCWNNIGQVYTLRTESEEAAEILESTCKRLSIPFVSLSSANTLNSEVIWIRTAYVKEAPDTGLSFFEGEHDIPFKINRFYTIFESEQDNQKGFHAHKQSWHLFFCPYGAIDVLTDNGKEKKVIHLDEPSKGLILHPGIWREMTWKEPGSVLCVAASGHYDADRLRTDYKEFQEFIRHKQSSATAESSEIMGDTV